MSRREELVKIANAYNEHSHIHISKLNDDELLFALWMRQMEVSTHGFGQYDEFIKEWCCNVDDNDNPTFDLNQCYPYILYKHCKFIPDFLYDSLLLPDITTQYGIDEKATQNLQKLNQVWKKLPISNKIPSIDSYTQLRDLLLRVQLNKLDLVSLVLIAEDLDLYTDNVSIIDLLNIVKNTHKCKKVI